MKIKVTMKGRYNTYHADGMYTGESFIVRAGGKIALTFADHIQGGRTALKYRNDRNYVDEMGNIIKDCEFSSPSTAAQFVSGTSKNGYVAWRVKTGETLKDYLRDKNLR